VNTVRTFKKMKESGEKIVMLTAYDYPSAKYTEAAGIDVVLVGDSLGMVVQGYHDTLQVTMDDMIYHTRATRRGAPDSFIIGDMPFMSYHVNVEETKMLLVSSSRVKQMLLNWKVAHHLELK